MTGEGEDAEPPGKKSRLTAPVPAGPVSLGSNSTQKRLGQSKAVQRTEDHGFKKARTEEQGKPDVTESPNKKRRLTKYARTRNGLEFFHCNLDGFATHASDVVAAIRLRKAVPHVVFLNETKTDESDKNVNLEGYVRICKKR